MRGFEGFFSPLDPRPVYTGPAGRRPWDGVEEKNKSSSERDPDRSPLSSSSSAGAPSSELPSQHPELAPPSTSSFGSIPSPSNRPENNRDLRQRLIGRATSTAQAPAPARAPRRDFGYDEQRERRWPASRVLLCRICACLAIVAFLGIVVVTRLVMHFSNGNASLEEVEPGGGSLRSAGVAAPTTAVGPTPRTATLDEPSLVQGALQQPNVEDDGRRVPLETTPVSPAEEAPGVLSKTHPLVSGKQPAGIEATPVKEDAVILEEEEEEEEKEDACWILLHMEKSGGGAARQIASEFWRKDELVFDTVQWRRGDSYAEDVMNSHWKLLHGGCAETLRNNDKARPCQWLTIFRHPVARLLSAYDHCREAPRDPLCPPTKSKDLAAFAERWGNFAMRQFALASVSQSAAKEWAARAQVPKGMSVWYLVKEYLTRGGTAEDAVLEGLLKPVQDLLSTQYAAVGIATEMDTTMRLFEKALSASGGLGWSSSLSKLRRRDNGEQDVEYDDAESATFRDALANPRIAAALRLDVLLYDHALRVFRKQVAHHGVG